MHACICTPIPCQGPCDHWDCSASCTRHPCDPWMHFIHYKSCIRGESAVCRKGLRHTWGDGRHHRSRANLCKDLVWNHLELTAWMNLHVLTYRCPWWTLGMTDKGCAESPILEPFIQSQTVQLQRQSHHVATLQPVLLFKKVYIP